MTDLIAASVKRIYYTADIVRPDGSDTFVYGEPTEPGHGATLEMGYLDPDWSMSEVCENREDVNPDVYADDDGSPIAWLAARIGDRLGAIEESSDTTVYAADSRQDFRTGVDVRVAAHIEGFSPEEISVAMRLLDSPDSVEQFMRNIAASFQTPNGYGLDFATYASTATITDGLSDAIQIEQLDISARMAGNGPVFGSDELPTEWLVELSALLAHVLEEYVAPWSVGHNLAGCLPDNSPSLHLSYADAISAYRGDLEITAEYHTADYTADGCDCCHVCLSGDSDTLAANPHDTDACGGGDTCEPCIEVAAIEGYLVDSVDTADGVELAYGTFDMRNHWLAAGELMTYGDYLSVTRD